MIGRDQDSLVFRIQSVSAILESYYILVDCSNLRLTAQIRSQSIYLAPRSNFSWSPILLILHLELNLSDAANCLPASQAIRGVAQRSQAQASRVVSRVVSIVGDCVVVSCQ